MNKNTSPHSAVYFYCMDAAVDPVAHRVIETAQALRPLQPTDFAFDGYPVLAEKDPLGNTFFHVRLNRVLSHAYGEYLAEIERRFAGCTFAGLVNWHEGEQAPSAIFCAHTTGDVPTGLFGPANPALFRTLLRRIEAQRVQLGLSQFRTLSEATHWSGLPHGSQPADLLGFSVPLVDIEIGSEPESWQHPTAAAVLARALVEVFEPNPLPAKSVLCGGGVHFEQAFADAVLHPDAEHPLAVSHILPNQWLVSGTYDAPDAVEKLQRCVASIEGGVDLIALHDKLKATYKQPFRELADSLGIPVVKHKALRNPAALPIW